MGPITNELGKDTEIIPHSDINDEIDKNDENIGTPKMNFFIGFIRFGNFASATAVIFVLVLNLMSIEAWDQKLLQNMLTCVQIVFLSIFAIAVYIDNIGTISFCWREYGELSSLHTGILISIYNFYHQFSQSDKQNPP